MHNCCGTVNSKCEQFDLNVVLKGGFNNFCKHIVPTYVRRTQRTFGLGYRENEFLPKIVVGAEYIASTYCLIIVGAAGPTGPNGSYAYTLNDDMFY